MKTLLPVALLAALSTLRGASAEDKAPAGDLARFQGTWTARVGPEREIEIRLTFQGNATTFVLARDGQEFESKGEIRIDEAATPYKTIDWIKFTSPNGDDVADNLGLYKFEGETLKLCNGGPGNERPAEFKAGEGGPPHLVVLRRGATGTATAPEATPKGDLAKFQGKWKVLIGPDKDHPIAVAIKGHAVTASGTGRDGQAFEIRGEVKLDEAAKPFKTIDWIKFTGPNGNEIADNLGLYEFDGDDAIKLCNGGPGNDRPAEFKEGEGGTPHLLVMRRDKD